MKKQTRSILEELNNLHQKRDSDSFIATTGNNIIESAINLLQRINTEYDQETALDLERRFINSIKSSDPRKFKRGLQKVVESKNKEL
jgi:predicted metal-dependent peptidase